MRVQICMSRANLHAQCVYKPSVCTNLQRRTTEHDGIGGEAMRALSDDDSSLCLVKGCREVFGTSYTYNYVFLGGAEDVGVSGR